LSQLVMVASVTLSPILGRRISISAMLLLIDVVDLPAKLSKIRQLLVWFVV
jgi:hypothetical protein